MFAKRKKFLPPHPPPHLLPSHRPLSRLQRDIWASLFQHPLSAGAEEFVRRGIPRLCFLMDILCLICLGIISFGCCGGSGVIHALASRLKEHPGCAKCFKKRPAQVGWDDQGDLSIFTESQVPWYWSVSNSHHHREKRTSQGAYYSSGYPRHVYVFFAFYPFHPMTR